jgi:hypothetical protein
MTLNEQIEQNNREVFSAMEEANRAEDEARNACELKKLAWARIVEAQIQGRPVDSDDIAAIEMCRLLKEDVAEKSRRFDGLIAHGDKLRKERQGLENRK